jgi:serine/threonine-protein kinase
VKPSNVILASVRDDDDRSHELAKVCDFGIAFDAVAAEGTYGALVGTPEYMSPELTRGDEVDARSDVYAVGVVLYELATGSVPFEDAKAERLFAMHRRAPPPSPRAAVPNLDPRLEAIILKALAKAPADRQQSMRELREELRALLAGDPSSAPAGRKPAVRAEGAWLEDSKQMYETFMMTAADEPVDLPGLTVARSLVTNADRWLAEFAAITDPQIAAREARGLEAALDILVEQDARSVLARVVVALRAAAGDAMPGLGTCAEIAARTLRAMEDPERLGAIARHALEGDGELDPDTLRLFVETRAAGAHALVAARATHDAPSARARFIAAMRAVRDPALPVILGELKRAFDAGDLATSEIEDLLRAVPPVADEAAGAIVAAFLRSPRAEVAAAALAATVRLWGHRARPLLIGAAENTPSAVRSVAVSGLRALGAVDAHAVRLLARVLSDRTSSLDARTSAAEALGVSQADARSAAGLVLERVLGETVAGTRIAAADPEAQRYVLALARSLLAVGGPSGVGLIRRCAGAPELPEQLREKLHTLVRAAPQK